MSRELQVKHALRRIIADAKQTDPELSQFSMRNVKEHLVHRLNISQDALKEGGMKAMIKDYVNRLVSEEEPLESAPSESSSPAKSHSCAMNPKANQNDSAKSDAESPASPAKSTPWGKRPQPSDAAMSSPSTPQSSRNGISRATSARSATSEKAASTPGSTSSKREFITAEEAEAEGYSSLCDDEASSDNGAQSGRASKSTLKKRRISDDDGGDGDQPSVKPASNGHGKVPAKEKATGGRKHVGKKKVAESPLEAELKRLKSLVVACGVRKQWGKFFEAEMCAGDDELAWRRQKALLHKLLGELGMSGRLSLKKAQQIKEEREFKMELKDIGVLGSPSRTRSSKAVQGRGRGRERGSALAGSESEDRGSDDHAGGSGDNDHIRKRQRPGDGDTERDSDVKVIVKSNRFKNSLASFAAELNSSDTD
ncbi:hypothetical protein K437DRAFT_267649 [Tilletiaria anomala UBC 951]|uniref:DEK C-terminal domain-containing protein n=1 Tax=Tilletiaria anomala (strain ATCC 24038 / CBS 436.72 / UBC 951) TaxID=1037660 RepID=A0A066W420_TILAU|nr:uncharacterized protein K437DRAFT_267649 [Tilletiaria anomala UBC 951]KDN48466.1 hypothetical protein K437DRAFT_267649 [Tilletiaria anomala UBC 951]